MLRRRRRGELGSGLVEFALIAPLLLLLVLGIVDVARIVNAYVNVSNASREGAHWASLHPASTEAEVVQNAIAPRVVPLNATTPVPMTVEVAYYDPAVPTFKPFPVPASSPQPGPIAVRVTVTYQIAPLTFFVGALLGQLGVSQLVRASSVAETIR